MDKPKLTRNGKYKQGFYQPKFPKKYAGDPTAIIYRSSLELRYIKYFDENPNILKWSSEEIQIPYISPLDGKKHTYFPDFAVKVRGKDNIVRDFIFEIKPKSQTVPPVGNPKTKRYMNEMKTFAVNQAKWEMTKKLCEMKGAQFVLLTEEEIKNRW